MAKIWAKTAISRYPDIGRGSVRPRPPLFARYIFGVSVSLVSQKKLYVRIAAEESDIGEIGHFGLAPMAGGTRSDFRSLPLERRVYISRFAFSRFA